MGTTFEAEGTDDDKMHFTFKPYVDLEGDIPEPTSDQIEEYFAEWRDIAIGGIEFAEELQPKDRDGNRKPETTHEQRQRESAQRERVKEFNIAQNRRRAECMAALCSDFPDADSIEKLPGRSRIRFQNYLMGELTPEG